MDQPNEQSQQSTGHLLCPLVKANNVRKIKRNLPSCKRKRNELASQGVHTDPKNKRKKEKARGKAAKAKEIPQIGDLNYKTATQLRNARKRRKIQREKQQQALKTVPKKKQNQFTLSANPTYISSENTALPSSLHVPTSSSAFVKDPSLRYIANPKSSPTVQAAIQFFKNKLSASISPKFPVFVGPTVGWRTLSRLAVRNDSSNTLRIGLFVPGTHELLEIPQCRAHHPRINSLVEVLQDLCHRHKIQAFDETTGMGNLRYVAIQIEQSTQKQQLVLIWKQQPKEEVDDSLQSLIDFLVKISQDEDKSNIDLHSIWVHYNNSWKHSNSIFDRQGKWEHKYGTEYVVETILNLNEGNKELYVPLHFTPQVFRQANLTSFSNIVLKIRQWLQSKLNHETQHKFSHCLELYGGVGTIGLHLLDLFQSMVSSDENPYNHECFERTISKIAINDELLSIQEKDNIQYYKKSTTEMLQGDKGLYRLQLANVIIVDPPRKGLDPEVLQALCSTYNTTRYKSATSITKVHRDKAQYLIYVSCGFDAFRRDYEMLVEKSNKWQLEHAEGHILFPGSDAIETLAFFSRK